MCDQGLQYQIAAPVCAGDPLVSKLFDEDFGFSVLEDRTDARAHE
jgi:hypothetical protein